MCIYAWLIYNQFKYLCLKCRQFVSKINLVVCH